MISERLRDELTRRGWRVNDLVRALMERDRPATYAAVHCWVSGRRTPHARYLPALADLLGTTTEALIEELHTCRS